MDTIERTPHSKMVRAMVPNGTCLHFQASRTASLSSNANGSHGRLPFEHHQCTEFGPECNIGWAGLPIKVDDHSSTNSILGVLRNYVLHCEPPYRLRFFAYPERGHPPL